MPGLAPCQIRHPLPSPAFPSFLFVQLVTNHSAFTVPKKMERRIYINSLNYLKTRVQKEEEETKKGYGSATPIMA